MKGFSLCIAWRHVREHLLSGVWEVFGDDFLQSAFSACADTVGIVYGLWFSDLGQSHAYHVAPLHEHFSVRTPEDTIQPKCHHLIDSLL